MKLAIITPTSQIPEFGNQGDFHLVLSHLLDLNTPNEYERHLIESGKELFLDNGLFENHKPEGLETLLLKVKRLNPTYFFAPDHLYDGDKTEEMLKKTVFGARLLKLQSKIGAVVQANNVEDYMNQLLRFNEDPSVDLIGLSILSIPKSFEEELGEFNVTKSRLALLIRMCELSKREGIQWKPCHLLGLGNSYEDVIFAKENCPFVISNDTSSCFQTGFFGKIYEKEFLEVPGGKIQEKVDFNLKEVSREQKEFIQKNINLIKEKICQ